MKELNLSLNENNLHKWVNFLKRLLKFLKYYKDLADSYVLDFYSMHLWNNVNSRWKETLESFTPSDLSNFLNKEVKLRAKTAFPLSLLAFRATCFSFVLPRNPANRRNDTQLYCKEASNRIESFKEKKKIFSSPLACNKEYEVFSKASHQEYNSGDEPYLLDHMFRKHLKPKKRHEVVQMARLCSRVFHSTESKVLVDVGSGQGHLARLVAYRFRIPTICLEAQQELTNGARKFDLELEKFIKKKSATQQGIVDQLPVGPRHETCRLHPQMTSQEFSKMLADTWPQLHQDSHLEFGLVGLHCCGDLGPTLVNLFSSLDSCTSLVLVGCCYMKLSTTSENELFEGYPMSKIVRGQHSSSLSYTAREMACHALEAYANKLKSGADDLKVHCYRAVLEELIIAKRPDLEHSGLRPVKKAHNFPFSEYVAKATSRLEGISFYDQDLETDNIGKKLEDWMKVVIYYSLRLMLAPAIESLIMLDRLFYLHENTKSNCFITPIFEPTLSPRNYALVASKVK